MQEPNTSLPDGHDPWEDDEDPDRDLKEFAFFSQLEQSGGKPSRKAYLGGCFMILPILALLATAFFFLLNKMY